MSRAFYDRVSGAYGVLAEPSERRCRDYGIDALGLQPGERVLEVGVGTGHGVAAMCQRVRPGGWVAGIDNSAGMLEVASRTIASVPGGVLIQADARSLPFAAAMFDAAFSSFTLESFAAVDIPRVLSELHRVLRAGGRLAVVALATSADPNPVTALYKWIHERFPAVADCRPIDAARLLACAGFRLRLEQTMHVWGLRVAVVTARKQDRGTPLRFPGPVVA